MNTTKWLWLVFLLLIVAWAVDLAIYYPQLPERVATHFNFAGHADDWSGKHSILLLNLALMAFIPCLFAGITLLLPIIPTSMINMPHKEFWLAPERAPFTLQILGGFVMGFGVATLAFLFVAMHLTLAANLTLTPHLGPAFWVALALYLLVELFLTIRIYVVFRV